MSKAKTPTQPHLFDVRLRDRLLASGALLSTDLERHLAALPDMENHTTSLHLAQPALSGDDEYEDEDEEDDA
jgi:hypothetical protein